MPQILDETSLVQSKNNIDSFERKESRILRLIESAWGGEGEDPDERLPLKHLTPGLLELRTLANYL